MTRVVRGHGQVSSACSYEAESAFLEIKDFTNSGIWTGGNILVKQHFLRIPVSPRCRGSTRADFAVRLSHSTSAADHKSVERFDPRARSEKRVDFEGLERRPERKCGVGNARDDVAQFLEIYRWSTAIARQQAERRAIWKACRRYRPAKPATAAGSCPSAPRRTGAGGEGHPGRHRRHQGDCRSPGRQGATGCGRSAGAWRGIRAKWAQTASLVSAGVCLPVASRTT